MEREKLVSLIVPVYNTEKWLPHCLECIAAQTWRNLDIILVDDGSTDASGHLCDTFAAQDSRCRVIHQQNQGIWKARNVGMDAARGDYLLLPDSDDYFHHDLVRLLVEAIESGPGYDVAIAGVKKTFSQDEAVSAPVGTETRQKDADALVRDLFDWRNAAVYAPAWNKLYRRAFVDGLRFHDYPRSQDVDFNLRLMMRSPRTVEFPATLYYWVQREGSLTHRPGAADTAARCLTQILFDNLQELSPDEERFRPLLLSQLYKKMTLWKGRAHGTRQYGGISCLIREWDARMRKDYRAARQIRPAEKALVLVLLRHPALTHGLMRLTNNL